MGWTYSINVVAEPLGGLILNPTLPEVKRGAICGEVFLPNSLCRACPTTEFSMWTQ